MKGFYTPIHSRTHTFQEMTLWLENTAWHCPLKKHLCDIDFTVLSASARFVVLIRRSCESEKTQRWRQTMQESKGVHCFLCVVLMQRKKAQLFWQTRDMKLWLPTIDFKQRLKLSHSRCQSVIIQKRINNWKWVSVSQRDWKSSQGVRGLSSLPFHTCHFCQDNTESCRTHRLRSRLA